MKKKGLMIIISALCCGLAQSQNTFEEFIAQFPLYDLDTTCENLMYLPKGKDLDFDITNKFIYDCPVLRQTVNNHSWATKGPNIMVGNGKFEHNSNVGRYYAECKGEFDTRKSILKATARFNFAKNRVALLIYEKSFNPETGWNEYWDLYTFNTENHIMLSVLSFEEGGFIVNKDTIVNFEKLYRGSDEESYAMILYGLREDGYFHKKEVVMWDTICNVDRFICDAVINDPDGYTNVRSKPNLKSTVLYQIEKERMFIVQDINNPNWYRVIAIYSFGDKRYFNGADGGYIHKSKVKLPR